MYTVKTLYSLNVV